MVAPAVEKRSHASAHKVKKDKAAPKRKAVASPRKKLASDQRKRAVAKKGAAPPSPKKQKKRARVVANKTVDVPEKKQAKKNRAPPAPKNDEESVARREAVRAVKFGIFQKGRCGARSRVTMRCSVVGEN